MKRIFILINDMNGGGAEKVLLTLLKNIPRESYQITLGLVYRRGPHLSNIPPDIPIRYLFEGDVRGGTARVREEADALYRAIAPQDSDIEIAFLEGNATKILGAGTCPGAKKVAWIHTNLERMHYTSYSYRGDAEELQTYRSYDRLIFVSQDAQDGFERLFGAELSDRSVVRYNPIDDAEVLRASRLIPVEKRCMTLCFFGRLVREKGFDRLLSVTERLQKDGFDFDFWILGEGPLREELTARARQLPRSDAVAFLGFQQNPYPYMLAADIFVSGSFVEGLSIVVGEALILGRRIVVPNCHGMAEALQGGLYGRLVENSEEGIYWGLRAELQSAPSPDSGEVSRQRFAPYDIRRQLPLILNTLDSI